jgi:hypothetical protein
VLQELSIKCATTTFRPSVTAPAGLRLPVTEYVLCDVQMPSLFRAKRTNR